MSGFCVLITPEKRCCELCGKEWHHPKQPSEFYFKICLKCVTEFAPSWNDTSIQLAILTKDAEKLN